MRTFIDVDESRAQRSGVTPTLRNGGGRRNVREDIEQLGGRKGVRSQREVLNGMAQYSLL